MSQRSPRVSMTVWPLEPDNRLRIPSRCSNNNAFRAVLPRRSDAARGTHCNDYRLFVAQARAIWAAAMSACSAPKGIIDSPVLVAVQCLVNSFTIWWMLLARSLG